MPTIDQIASEFQAGHKIKDLARKSKANYDMYNEASQHFAQASKMAFELSTDVNTDDIVKIKSKIYSLYYASEEHSCLSSYYYEKRDNVNAKSHHSKSLDFIKQAIEQLEIALPILPAQDAKSMEDHLPNWRYIEASNIAATLAPDARKAWDEGDLIKALDCYRRTADQLRKAMEISRDPTIEPVYERIATGNYIGMMANASSTLARIAFEKGRAGNANSSKTIPNDLAFLLIGYTLDAHNLAMTAFDKNPEWDQYREGAKLCIENIKTLLKDNEESWLDFYLHFENNSEFLRIMKMTDINRFKDVENQRYFKDNKAAKLWQVGSFWLLALIIISGIVFLIADSNFGFPTFFFILVGIEVILLIIGALTLRSIGELSETGFLKLVGIALTSQLKFWKLFNKKNSKESV